MTTRLHLVDGREYEVKADCWQFTGWFDRERLAFVSGRTALTVADVQHVRELPTFYDKRDRLHWFDVDSCYLAPRRATLPWTHPYAVAERTRRRGAPRGAARRTRSAEYVLAFVVQHPACTVQQCATAVAMHPSSARRLLLVLHTEGVVERRRVRNTANPLGYCDVWHEATAAPPATAADGLPA